jgi:flagellar motor protein MotB
MMAFFDSGSATIMEQSRRSLRNMFVADGLGICSPNSRPLFLCVTGHTDKSGDETANRRLSLLRAQAVADYLVELGVAREHIAVRGRGSSEMLVQQSPPYGSEPQNRRVQIVWDKKAAFATCK